MSEKKLGLVPKLIIGIIVGIILGSIAPAWFNRIIITMSSFFSSFLKFIIPLMILAFVTMGIADLSQGAGKLLAATAGISYGSMLMVGACAYIVAAALFPHFITPSLLENIGNPEAGMLTSYLDLPIPPLLDVMSAVVFAFVLVLCISSMRGREIHDAVYDVCDEFSQIVNMVLHTVIIPFMPLYICGTVINMTVSGQVFVIFNIFWKVFVTIITLQLAYLVFAFTVGGLISKKNPVFLMKNQISGYLSAAGTQSSAAAIPVNLECADAMGISREIRNFTIPLCSNIHMPGSMITITSCVTAVMMMYKMPYDAGVMVPLILTLGVTMMASPGVPSGSIITALPFLAVVGIPSDGAIASLLTALYITQDSFGTACNVSGDNAVSVVIDTIYRKRVKE